jgi:isoaspartyl peptidase/L-asparaginase-like protein (Ntn-hydrolase superfamily)
MGRQRNDEGLQDWEKDRQEGHDEREEVKQEEREESKQVRQEEREESKQVRQEEREDRNGTLAREKIGNFSLPTSTWELPCEELGFSFSPALILPAA